MDVEIDDKTVSGVLVKGDEDEDNAADKVLAVDDEVGKGMVVVSDREDEGEALARRVVNVEGDGRGGGRRVRAARRSILVVFYVSLGMGVGLWKMDH